jgi:alkylresorcinol/alkylpyrone synthase
MQVASVGRAFPSRYYPQSELIDFFQGLWATEQRNVQRLENLHRSTLVRGRHLVLAIDAYGRPMSFTEANDTFIASAIELGEHAIRDGLDRAGLVPQDIDHLIFVSVTGVAAPSIDARLVNRLGLRTDVKRTPIFGLGCVAGVAGIARAADYLRAFPEEVAVLLAVELCSLTLQRQDASLSNMIASGLFGDGAAAVIMVGQGRVSDGPRVVATRSVFYRDTERSMGWDISADGFRIVLSADVPKLVGLHLRADVDRFLSDRNLSRSDIGSYVCHPGGPRVIEAVQRALDLDEAALAATWESLKAVGNLSSASVLMVLRDTMETRRPPPGTYGLMIAMGPGFCAELVLLQW